MSEAYLHYWANLGRTAPNRAVLVADTYNFSAAHADVAADIMPHAIGDVVAPVTTRANDTIINLPVEYQPYVAPIGWGASADVEFADADTSYAVATLRAVVLFNSAETGPLLYLDHETFPVLPTPTLGGAVTLHIASSVFGNPPVMTGSPFVQTT
jgi:hypothetical protein